MMGPVPKSPERRRGPSAEKPADKKVGRTVEKELSERSGPLQGPADQGDVEKNGAEDRSAPKNVTGHTRVNVAFPFSKISVQEPRSELIELAALMADLVGVLAEWVPEETLAEIRTRAEALCTRLSNMTS